MRRWRLFLIFWVLFYAVAGTATLLFCPLQEEEGISLYAGKLACARGLFTRVFGQQIYLARIIGLLCGALTLPLCFKIAQGLAGTMAGILSVILVSSNIFSLSPYLVNIPYAMAMVFVTLSVFIKTSRIKEVWRNVLSIFAMYIAVSLESTFTPLLVAVLIHTVFTIMARNLGSRKASPRLINKKMKGLWVVLGLMIFVAVLRYNSVGEWSGALDNLGSILALSALFAAVLAIGSVRLIPKLIAAPVKAVVAYLRRYSIYFLISLFALWLAVMSAHSHPTYYLTFKSGFIHLAAITVGCSLGGLFIKDKSASAVKVILVVLVLLTPLAQAEAWFAETLNLEEPLNARPFFTGPREVAGFIQANTRPDQRILTFSPAIALYANRQVLHGLEGGAESYCDEDTARCRETGCVNGEILDGYLDARQAGAVILTDTYLYHSYIRPSPDLPAGTKKLLAENYYLAKTIAAGISYGKARVYLPIPR